jgi:hypothetical protein
MWRAWAWVVAGQAWYEMRMQSRRIEEHRKGRTKEKENGDIEMEWNGEWHGHRRDAFACAVV